MISPVVSNQEPVSPELSGAVDSWQPLETSCHLLLSRLLAVCPALLSLAARFVLRCVMTVVKLADATVSSLSVGTIWIASPVAMRQATPKPIQVHTSTHRLFAHAVICQDLPMAKTIITHRNETATTDCILKSEQLKGA